MSGECFSVSVGGKCTLRDECTVPHILQYMPEGAVKTNKDISQTPA